MNPSSLIAVVAIDATSNTTRNEATATNSVLKPQGGLAGEHDKSVVRVS